MVVKKRRGSDRKPSVVCARAATSWASASSLVRAAWCPSCRMRITASELMGRPPVAGATRRLRPAGTSRAGMMVFLMWSVMMSGSTISWWAANSASTAVVLAMSVQVAWRREVVKACLTFRWAVLLLGVVRRMRVASSQKTWCMLCGTSFAMVRRAWYAALRLLGAWFRTFLSRSSMAKAMSALSGSLRAAYSGNR